MKDLIRAVRGSAGEVFEELGPGYKEGVYEEALAHEFRLREVPYERQKNCELIYKGHAIGTTRIDLVVDGELIVETKAVRSLTESHRNQVRAYYETSGLSRGILLNFPPDGDKVAIEKIPYVSVEGRPGKKPAPKKGKAGNTLNQVAEAANEVCGILGTEFAYRGDASIYENALNVEFRLREIPYVHRTSELIYKDHVVETFPAFVVGGKHLVHLTFEEEISEELEEEARFAIGLSGLRRGLIINFPPGAVSVEVKKISAI